MTRTVRVAIGLGVVYALTLASTDPVDLVMGAVLGGVLVTGLGRRLRLEPGGHVPSFGARAANFPRFLAGVLLDVLAGTWDVALRVVHLREVERPGIVRIPIGERTERGVAVSALVTTLSPGSVLIDVDWDRGDMLLHVIDSSDPDGVRAQHERFYERYQRGVFPVISELIFFGAIGWLAVLIGVSVAVVARAPTTSSRILALDLLTLLLIGVLALVAGEDMRPYALDAGLALALLSFVGTLAACRYHEDRRPFR